MTDTSADADHAKDRLFKTIDHERYGMLGVSGGEPRHMQPMTAFHDEGESTLWFFTKHDTDLVKDVGAGRTAMFCVMAKDRELQACIAGQLSASHDRERIEKYWGPMVSAWFPEGKDDPSLCVLRFDMSDAQIWLSDQNPVKFYWEMVRANVTDTPPDVGDRANVSFQ